MSITEPYVLKANTNIFTGLNVQLGEANLTGIANTKTTTLNGSKLTLENTNNLIIKRITLENDLLVFTPSYYNNNIYIKLGDT